MDFGVVRRFNESIRCGYTYMAIRRGPNLENHPVGRERKRNIFLDDCYLTMMDFRTIGSRIRV